MYEAWTNIFADPGTRTTGTGAGEFAIVGPNWHGELPPGVEEFRSSTNLVWLIGRTYCTGTPEDYAAVHAIQDQYKLVPLSAYGKPYTPPPGKVDPTIEMNVAPREQVERMDTISFFELVSELMKQIRLWLLTDHDRGHARAVIQCCQGRRIARADEPVRQQPPLPAG
jgi:hypothetical protein